MMKSKYVLVFVLVFGIASVSSADPWGRDYSGFDEDTTAVVYGVGGTADAAYYYGFEVDPTTTAPVISL